MYTFLSSLERSSCSPHTHQDKGGRECNVVGMWMGVSNMHAIEIGVRSGSEFLCGGNASAVLSTCRAIMRYHQAKMDEINEYIRDLWLKIYKGSGEQRHVPYTILSSTFYLTPLSPPLHFLFQTLTALRSGQRMTRRRADNIGGGCTSTE